MSLKRVSNNYDFDINFDDKATKKDKNKGAEEPKKKSSLFSRKKENTEKIKKEKVKKSIFDRRKVQEEILVTEAVSTNSVEENHIQENILNLSSSEVEFDDVTMIIDEASGTRFSYIGMKNLPREIVVDVSVGDIFTIGRFDKVKAVKQSDFEFPADTKAISRCHHAVVERRDEGYFITDMKSSGGTYLNLKKLPANAPFKMAEGDRVSFGNVGADYIWREE